LDNKLKITIFEINELTKLTIYQKSDKNVRSYQVDCAEK
jgi:hypothetical protein